MTYIVIRGEEHEVGSLDDTRDKALKYAVKNGRIRVIDKRNNRFVFQSTRPDTPSERDFSVSVPRYIVDVAGAI